MENLNNFYKEKGITQFEGYSQQVPGQCETLKRLVNQENIVNVMEIGFNGGHSAEIFLSSNKNVKLVSFDIGYHSYVKLGKEFIDNKYPNRHELILGDSLKTVPEYNNMKFDLIFIDGDHSYNGAKGDLLNCKRLSHKDTIVIMDDTMTRTDWIHGYNIGPNQAWNEAKEWRIIKEVGSENYCPGRGQSWGIFYTG